MDRINQEVNPVANKKRDRGPDWNEIETTFLLGAAQDVQLKNGRSDLNFTATDMSQILALFQQQFPEARRTAANLKTRIGTIKKEFSIFRGWATKSGWSWDYANHMPIAPTPEILKDVIEKGGRRTKYFEGKQFPWYAKMEEIMGGKKTKGRQRDKDNEGTQGSATGSQTDSSDNPPDDGDQDATTEGSAKASRSTNSNKRNSTELTEQSTQAKRLHLKASERRSEIKEMNATGKEIVQSVKHYAQVKQAKKDEINECLKKLEDLNVRGQLRYMCVKKIELQTFRSLFLTSSLEEIKEYFEYEMNYSHHPVNPAQGSYQNTHHQGANFQPQPPPYIQGPFMQYFQPQPPPSQECPPNQPFNFPDPYNPPNH